MRRSFFRGYCHPLFDRAPVTLVAGLGIGRRAPRADLKTGCDGKNARPTGMRRSFFRGYCHPLFDRAPVTLVAGLGQTRSKQQGVNPPTVAEVGWAQRLGVSDVSLPPTAVAARPPASRRYPRGCTGPLRPRAVGTRAGAAVTATSERRPAPRDVGRLAKSGCQSPSRAGKHVRPALANARSRGVSIGGVRFRRNPNARVYQ